MQLDIPDDLADTITKEAAETHQGDATAYLRDTVNHWKSIYAASAKARTAAGTTGKDFDPAAAAAAALASFNWISTDVLANIGATMTALAHGTTAARTGAIDDWVAPIIDWIRTDPTTRRAACTLVTTQPPGGQPGAQLTAVISVATGLLSLDEKDSELTGTLTQTFSDRRTAQHQPFDPASAETIRLTINTRPGIPAAVIITAQAGEQRSQTLRDTATHAGVLTATGESVGWQAPAALYTLTLGRVTQPG